MLTTRTDNLKAHQERKSMFSAAPEGGAARQPLFSQPGAPAVLQRRRGAARPGEARSCVRVRCMVPVALAAAAAATRLQEQLPTPSPCSLLPAGASFLPPNARNPLAPAVRGGLQGGGSDESAPLLGGGGGQQQQALMVPAQDQYLASRAEALHQVGPEGAGLGQWLLLLMLRR